MGITIVIGLLISLVLSGRVLPAFYRLFKWALNRSLGL